jgi:tetratricopeptide (TPR) repeat protein
MTYGWIVLFVTSGRAGEHQGAEWIHKAYQFGQRSQSRHPLLDLVAPLERMLREPGAAVSAFDSLMDNEDPWVRALARWQAGKMRIVLGQGGPRAVANLELALAEFRTLGERFGISIALSEVASQLATRGEFASACSHYEEAIAVVTEVGAIEDAIQLRTQQALLYWLQGDRDSSATAIAEAERGAEGVTWPYALIELALAKASLARWGGNAGEARHQLGIATALLGDDAEQAHIRAAIYDRLGYLADDLDEARSHHMAAWQAALEAGHPSLIAQIMVGVADLALRREQYEQAARLLSASVSVRGMPDRSHPDATRIERDTQRHLGEVRYAEVTREGTETNSAQLVEAALAS